MSTYLRSSFTPCWHYGYFSLHPKCLTPNRGLTEGNTHSHFTHFLSPPALPPLSGGKAGFWDMGDVVAAWPEQRRAWTSSQGQINEVCSGPKLCQIQWQQRRRTHLSPQLLGAAVSQMALPRKIQVRSFPSFTMGFPKVLA